MHLPTVQLAGDSWRRVKRRDLESQMGTIIHVRVEVWRQQPAEFLVSLKTRLPKAIGSRYSDDSGM